MELSSLASPERVLGGVRERSKRKIQNPNLRLNEFVLQISFK